MSFDNIFLSLTNVGTKELSAIRDAVKQSLDSKDEPIQLQKSFT